MLDLFYLVILLPLLGFLHNGLLFRKITPRVSGTIGTLMVFLPFLITLGAFLEFNPMERTDPYLFTILPWIQIGSFKVDFGYQVDQLSLYMTLIITGIGTLIHLYSIGYMKLEVGFNRFFAYLNLFIFSMLNLVLSDNLVLTFLGWEGVGLCSYLLIGFEYEKKSAADAGMKAFVVNRIGDFGFIIAMALVYWFTGTLKYVEIVALLPGIDAFQSVVNWVAIFFFIAAIGKSAQIPLFVWLPDAMAGPTPVSALIHAATMVTAGIFLIARMNIVFLNAELASLIIAWTGGLTALMAASIAIFQNDIKKVLAYSTVSQLGYMFLAMGVGAYVGGLFHLMTHAFFKALLFLGAGSVIYGLHHEQDIQNMGGVGKYMKITFLTFAIGTIAISGLPPFSGFFSKDLILEKAFAYGNNGEVLWGIGILTALLTSFYMFRLFFLTFMGEERLSKEAKSHLHESPWTMTLPLVLLAVGAAVMGFLQTPFYAGSIDLLQQYFQPVLEPGFALQAQWNPNQELTILSHSTEAILAAISVGLAIIGLIFAYRLLGGKILNETDRKGFTRVLADKYYIDEFYDAVFVRGYKALSNFVSETLDKKVIDRFFLIIGFGFGTFAGALRRVQTGFVGDYALYIVLGTIAIMAYVIVKGV
ncbi:MAG: NADH-quinone oxidoreductase subunit L [Leptospira sp.]|nr:NADH-quinone oxidoreductase subunit L [Leptospira sp.]